MDCIFCKIAQGEIPTKKIMETANSLAFLDAFPLTKGHSLVIPKKHYEKIQEMSKEEIADLFDTVKQITSKSEKIVNASLIAVHNGRESGQEIPHVHVHVIPRKPEDNAGPVHMMFKNRPKLSDSEFDEILSKLKD
ncbi:MAG: HIT domain-containing protein [Thaumarchaeota archaeon]|nr:HIT domain-containing protein [Nitrososphaerota archaeon]GFN40216.1 MAG: HIT superfamily hydrolase [Marine Group I thaumarchaeote]